MNDKIIKFAEKDSIYENNSPLLFWDQFAKETKETLSTCIVYHYIVYLRNNQDMGVQLREIN